MTTVIGVVGPHDLVRSVADLGDRTAGVRIRRYPYSHETEAEQIVGAHAADVDAWLFTGVIPYTYAADRLNRPALYIDYTGTPLLHAIVQLLKDGADITRMSIDTLATSDVLAVLTESDLPTDGIRSLPFRAGVTSQTLIDFHRRHAADGSVAITCVASVYEALRGEIPVLRLVPSWKSVRTTLHQLLLLASNQSNEDAHVVLGLVEASPWTTELERDLAREAAGIAGTYCRVDDGRGMIVTTRGPLADVTAQFTSAPILRRLAADRERVQIGFGFGRTAAEAESLARRALSRARSHGDVAAAASFRNDVDIVLDTDRSSDDPPLEQAGIGVITARVGLSAQTVRKLRDAAAGSDAVTTRDIAGALSIEQRTARRMMQRLELAGYAERVGQQPSGTSGRPLTLYKLNL